MQITIEITNDILEQFADAIVAKLNKCNLSGPNFNKERPQKWLTHAEAAAYIRKSIYSLYKLTSERKVKYTKRGKQNLYLIENLDIFMNEGEVKTESEISSEVKLQPRKTHSIQRA